MPASATTLRFYVAELTRQAHDPEAAKITLNPAYNNGKGNEAWAKATPSGKIELYVSNPPAVEFYALALRERRDIHITMEYAPLDKNPVAQGG